MLAPQDLMSKDIEELRQLVLDRKEEKKEKASKPSKKERRQKQEQQERAAERAERQQQEKAERREQEKAAKEQQQQQQQQQDSDRAEPMEEDGNGPLDITNVRAPPCCLLRRAACLPAWPLLAGPCWLDAAAAGLAVSWQRRCRAVAGRRAGCRAPLAAARCCVCAGCRRLPCRPSRQVTTFAGHASEVFICAWSPTEPLLASG
jgi:hypothetical protein